ncbi:MAG TPA: helix-turn-helix domain-containing protein [Kiloniellales bacterium]|nr:helix-turn-helix domain-containing protein [Kiloniellales bacterium]
MLRASPLSVSLLALPETTLGTLYSLHEVFASAGVAWNELTGRDVGAPLMAPLIVSRDGRSFRSPCGPLIAPQASFQEAPRSDVVVISDLQLSPHEDPRKRWPLEVAWCRRQYAQGAVLCSVCTGSIFLAATSLLDGAEATSHWAATELFARFFPAVKLLPERILVVSGDGERIVTSGGAASWQDLALYLVARFCGPAEAVQIAKVFLLNGHSEGQLLYSVMKRTPRHDDPIVAHCQTWLADHYHEPHPVKRMMVLSGLKERTFKRRFHAATGYSPIAYVQAMRVEEAKQLLETTTEPIDDVAVRIGYEDGAFFRRLFKRSTGITPARYRQRFQFIGRQAAPVAAVPSCRHATIGGL